MPVLFSLCISKYFIRLVLHYLFRFLEQHFLATNDARTTWLLCARKSWMTNKSNFDGQFWVQRAIVGLKYILHVRWWYIPWISYTKNKCQGGLCQPGNWSDWIADSIYSIENKKSMNKINVGDYLLVNRLKMFQFTLFLLILTGLIYSIKISCAFGNKNFDYHGEELINERCPHEWIILSVLGCSQLAMVSKILKEHSKQDNVYRFII